MAQETQKLTLVDPSCGEPFATVPMTGPDTLDQVLDLAGHAQLEWRRRTPDERSLALWRWSALIEESHRELAELDVRATGKTIRDAVAESRRASRHARHWAGQADKIFGQQLADVPGRLSFTSREPLGTCAVILPANAPTHAFAARVSPVLACGNAAVVKPSELSPQSAVRLAELAEESGMPPGLLSVVVGGGELGAALVADRRVAGVSFTGGVRTGRAIAAAVAHDLKKCVFELGGKSPVVVFADADLEGALDAVTRGVLQNAGQICAAGTRLVVEQRIADEFVARLAGAFDDVVVGDPRDPRTDMGPVSCRAQLDRITDLVETGARARADVHRSALPAQVAASGGFFVGPTIVSGVDSMNPLWRQEVFGPVLTVQEFSTDEEAVALANRSDHGLAAYVWTQDVTRMLRTMEAIEAGVVHGNTGLVMDSQLPFGGFKDSGLGGAYGADAVEAATRTKRYTLGFGAPTATSTADDHQHDREDT